MPAELVIDVADGLELKGRMFHVEVAGQAALQVIEDPTDLAPRDAVVGDDDVRGEYRQRRGERPHVQIVHGGHFFEFEEMAAHLLQVDVLGGGLEKNPERGAEKPDGCLHHETHYDERGDRVGAIEPGGDDDDSGNHRPDEGIQVGEDVTVGTFHVERTPVCSGHRHRGGQVDRHAD